jgi:transposase
MASADSVGEEDIESLKRQLVAERELRAAAEARAAEAAARATSAEALIAHLRLAIEKLKRDLYGSRSEHGRKLIEQMELQLEELVANAAEDSAKAEFAPKGETIISTHVRRHPVRKPLPAHLPRERVIVPGPTACPCFGSSKLAKLGEDVTETLEVIPRQWKVIQYVREKFTCRACETLSQAPAPFHVISRGRSGANLLAMVLYAKFGLHQPLNRQSAEYAKEGIDLPLSTLADHVGACAAVLQPLVDLIRAHVFADERIHGDETPVKLLAKTKCHQARLWTYVRDDRPFGGRDPPAAVYHFSRDRHGEHPERHLAGYGGILQADCYGGYNGLYRSDRLPRPITEAACWAHAPGASSSCSPISRRRRRIERNRS